MIKNDVLLIDKPAGWTSHDVVQRVKQICGAKKAGHAGTLDPMATGMLIVCLDQATSLQSRFMGLDKEYQALLRLGARTDTGDQEGRVVEERPIPDLNWETIAAVFPGFQGERWQRPPPYSAVKFKGKPAHRWARAGKEVSLAPRLVNIQRLELVGFRAPEIEFSVLCSKGTYVRVLGEEIAQALGTVGHLVALRRTACGPYRLNEAVTLEGLAVHRKELYNPKSTC